MSDEWKAQYEKRREEEYIRLQRPATAADIEKLIQVVNSGWVGRGFAIGFGIWLLGILVGLLLIPIWMSL